MSINDKYCEKHYRITEKYKMSMFKTSQILNIHLYITRIKTQLMIFDPTCTHESPMINILTIAWQDILR